MVTVLRTTNLVRLSFLRALLRDSAIEAQVFDANISALEAGIGAVSYTHLTLPTN